MGGSVPRRERGVLVVKHMVPNFVAPDSVVGRHYDIVVVGSGFGSGFFLHEALKRDDLKVLVIEWGDHYPHEWQIANKRNSAIAASNTYETVSDKPWIFTIGFGGGTNCWFAQTPRFHPSDFKLKSRYGVGNDWPIDYDELEPFYADAESVMSISGDPDMAAMFPRSTPYPQPAHRMSSVDRLMKAAQPHHHFVMPTARARIATHQRSACCASLTCNLCPVNAKFTVSNGLEQVFGHENVSVCLKSRALRYESTGTSVSALVFEHNGKEHRVAGDLFVLGANAVHSPAILMHSDMGGGLTGKGLHESYGADLEVYLEGLDNFDGSTITTGLNFGIYDGPFRSEYAAAMIFFENYWAHGLRREYGRWRQTVPIMIVTEDLLDPENAVTVSAGQSRKMPTIQYRGASEYAKNGMKKAIEKLPELLAPLPVEDIIFRKLRKTEAHLQGTLRMGRDPTTSVVDERMIHHRYRNLVVVGTSVFPTCSCANPSLTAAALSVRAARMIL
jgi:choline dehydrogenase-like flavoprotein